MKYLKLKNKKVFVLIWKYVFITDDKEKANVLKQTFADNFTVAHVMPYIYSFNVLRGIWHLGEIPDWSDVRGIAIKSYKLCLISVEKWLKNNIRII